MADREYHGFAIFYNDKKQRQSSPDYSGNGTLSPEVLDYITECWKNGQNPKLEVVGWMKQSQRGTKFQSININIPWEVRKERQEGGGNDRQPRQQQRGRRQDDRQSGFPDMNKGRRAMIPTTFHSNAAHSRRT